MPLSKASASFPAALLGDNWQVTRWAHRPLLLMWRRLKRYNSDVKSRRAILPETERRNPRSAGLDRKSTIEVLRILNREDASVPRAVARELPAIARAVDKIVRAFRSGGRLIYVGAGSSGRMGALDAAECPPTFGVPETQVQAILAGGLRAMTHAVEGAEDSPRDGARQIAARRVGPNDVVVGIAAAGTTPFTLGALRESRRRGATTVALTANRRTPIARLADIVIAPATGPEVIAGSTRLKAGTAQKLVLNMLSTAAMVRMGFVFDNLMINVSLTNEKLRHRAVRIIESASGIRTSSVQHAVRQAGHDLRAALVMLKAGVDAQQARWLLAASKGNLREAIATGLRLPRTKDGAHSNRL
jgi:N-acetylmuramic acid 6-phosphate etherase